MLDTHRAKSLIHLRPCVLVLAAALSVPALAQSTGGGGATGTGTTTAESRRDSDRRFDWGWLGLIGLAGLLGRRRPDTDSRIDTTRTSGQR
jgi:hypothetical protein